MIDIEKVLEMDENTLLHHIELDIDLDHYTSEDNFLYYQNKQSNLMLVSHVDTVRSKKAPLVIEREKDIITAYKSVLGADDRAGVWAMLYIYHMCKDSGITVPNLLFTNYEESGGIGMNALTTAGIKYFKHIHLGIALDRRGCNEYVTYNHLPKHAAEYVESFGWMRSIGTFNDIEYFVEAYLIPCVNVSIGYYNAHTTKERLHMDETMFCIERIMRMIKAPIDKCYKVDPGYGVYDHYYGDYYGGEHKSYHGKKGNKKEKTSKLVDDYYGRNGCEGDLCVVCGEDYGTKWVKEYGYSWSWMCSACSLYYGGESKHEESDEMPVNENYQLLT